jgi:ABC-type phosphate transport system substrate-binding protein
MKTRLAGLALVALTALGVGCSSPVLDAVTPSEALAADASSSEVLDSAASGSSTARAGEIRITLSSSAAFVSVKAKAKYKNRNGERELQVEAENLRVGTVVSICISGVRAGGATANALGNARLNLNSNAGQTVPNLSSGTAIAVRAGGTCAGALIASGSF